jgi:5-methylcytosine-specific restriction endonuclease McrA
LALAGDWPTHRITFWDADHIKEVCRGGGLCGLENLQTLCVLCHRKKTRELRSKDKEGANAAPADG